MYKALLILKGIKKLLPLKQCPICHNRFPAYLIGGNNAAVWKKYHGVGGGIRRTTCPYCGCGDRERLVFLYLRDIFLPKHREQKQRTLHVAPEQCLSKYLRKQPNIEYLACDKRCEGYSYPDYVQDVDIMNLSTFSENSFDLIICNHVLEHVENDIIAMHELLRILKPSGTAILQVPYVMKLQQTYEDPTIIMPEARFESYGQHDHLRLYGLDYPNRLKQAGFNMEVLNIAKNYPKKLGLNRDEHLFICHKP